MSRAKTIRDALEGLRSDMTDAEARQMATAALKPPMTWNGLPSGIPVQGDEKTALEALLAGDSLDDPLPTKVEITIAPHNGDLVLCLTPERAAKLARALGECDYIPEDCSELTSAIRRELERVLKVVS